MPRSHGSHPSAPAHLYPHLSAGSNLTLYVSRSAYLGHFTWIEPCSAWAFDSSVLELVQYEQESSMLQNASSFVLVAGQVQLHCVEDSYWVLQRGCGKIGAQEIGLFWCKKFGNSGMVFPQQAFCMTLGKLLYIEGWVISNDRSCTDPCRVFVLWFPHLSLWFFFFLVRIML